MSPEQRAVVDGVAHVRRERDELLELLRQATTDVVGTSSIDGLTTVRIPGDVMARIRAVAGT